MSTSDGFVIDANVIIHGRGSLPFDNILIPRPVYDEVKSELSKIKLESLDLKVFEVNEECLKKVERKSEEISAGTSEEDNCVAALALEKDLLVVTDDKELQNLCWHLDLDFEGFLEDRIETKRKYVPICENCGARLSSKGEDCPKCGSSEVTRKNVLA